MATPKKTNPQPSIAQFNKAAREVREHGTPTNMSLADFEAYQKRFDAVYQPADARRGKVTNAELYGSEKRLVEELIIRGLPAMIWEQIKIATGQGTQFLINHKSGEVEEVPANPKDVILAYQGLSDRVFGKPETHKHVTETSESTQRLTILIGPAADDYNAEQERIRGALPLATEPLVLPSPSPEELLALPEVFESREIRKVALDTHLAGGDPYEVRAAVQQQFGSRDARRARRKEAKELPVGEPQ